MARGDTRQAGVGGRSVRILLVVDGYLPMAKSQVKLMHDLGVEMSRQGHDVVVLAPSHEIRQPFELSFEDGLLIARAKTWHIRGASRILRAIGEERLSSVLWSAGRSFFKERQFDLIVFYS